MKHFHFLHLFIAVSVIICSCSDNISPTAPIGNKTEVRIITTTLAGVIIDAEGKAISDVIVTAAGKSVTTDKYGAFMIPDVSVSSDRCFIICKKNGYFNGGRAVTPQNGGITEFRFTMQSTSQSFFLDSFSGGKIALGNGAVLSFPSSSFVTSDGTQFKGNVKISISYFNPSVSSFYNSFPGDLRGRRIDGSTTFLLSYGALNIEIKDESGNELKLDAGKKATLTYPMSSSMLKNNQDSVPLWYFDEKIGMWQEDGSAKKSGNYYTGQVSHLSCWNLALPQPSVIVKGRVICSTNQGVARIYVTVGQAKILTDTGGYFSCLAPAKSEVDITVAQGDNRGSSTAPLSIATGDDNGKDIITIPLKSSCPTTFLTGTIVDCNNKPIAATILLSISDVSSVHFTSTGEFKIPASYFTPIVIHATTFDGQLIPEQFVDSLPSEGIMDLGRVSTCGEVKYKEFYDLNIGLQLGGDFIISPDGSMIAYYGYAATFSLSVYDIKTRLKLCEFSTNEHKLEAVSFSEDGTKLLINWQTDSAIIVNPHTGSFIQSFGNIKQPRMMSDGSAIVAFENSSPQPKLSMFSVADGSKIKDFSFNGKNGNWSVVGTRNSNQIVLLQLPALPYAKYTGDIEIVHWDVPNDTKLYDINFPNVNFAQITGNFIQYSVTQMFSPDLSVFFIVDSATRVVNFYNGQTGLKLNTVQLKANYVSLSNKLSYVTQGISDNQSSSLIPTTYSISDGKLQKTFTTENSVRYSQLRFSSNSQFLAGLRYYEFKNDYSPIKIRIWNVK